MDEQCSASVLPLVIPAAILIFTNSFGLLLALGHTAEMAVKMPFRSNKLVS